ncbi:unnamed protein product, partial [Mesorhabditis belari]|uniref:TFIIS N-terminal domain-containing protein n=1 Tax=Mesorhabditis belari TaxID=2138241 RepID=A0AAF3EZ87_9BILA
MVGCVTLTAVPSLVSLSVAPMTAMTQVTVSYVDQLKKQLQQALENDEEKKIDSLIDEIEKLTFTKDLLQVTHFGAELNSVRKILGEKWPAIAKKCRNIIKTWQQLIQTNSSSATSSTNGTPNILGRRLTPATPVARPVPLTEKVNEQSSPKGILRKAESTSPTTTDRKASEKPKSSTTSPRITIAESTSTTLLLSHGDSIGLIKETTANEIRTNGKRKGEEIPPTGLKRVKTVAGDLPSTSTPAFSSSAGQSVLAARRQASQSTADMIAQMSSNLSSASDLASLIRNHQIQVQREEADEQFAQSLAAGAAQVQSPYVRGKRKYERKMAKVSATQIEPSNEEQKGIRLRISKTTSNLLDVDNGDEHPNPLESWPATSKKSREKYESKPSASSAMDWYANLQSLEELHLRAEKIPPVRSIGVGEGRQAHFIKRRELLVMPLISDTVKPDFLVHNYPEKHRFYAEENFLYGREKPTEE